MALWFWIHDETMSLWQRCAVSVDILATSHLSGNDETLNSSFCFIQAREKSLEILNVVIRNIYVCLQ